MSFRMLLIAFLLLGMSACSSERSDRNVPARGEAKTDTLPAPQDARMPQPIAGQQIDPEEKTTLLRRLEAIRQSNLDGRRDSEIQTLITELSGLTRVLAVTAVALDRGDVFKEEIEREIARFEKTERGKKEDATRIMNGMSGVYSMYALLAKMRFVGQADRQQEIQEMHDETASVLQSESTAVEAAAAIAEACYTLSSMIISDIDSDGRYDKAFEQIERQYQQGARVAIKREDVFINGIFRTYEVSQLWLLSINPNATDIISELNAGVSQDSGDATNVGMQMGIAAKYLFLISYLIAKDTVNLTH